MGPGGQKMVPEASQSHALSDPRRHQFLVAFGMACASPREPQAVFQTMQINEYD